MKTQSKQSADGVRCAGVKLNKQLIAKRREIDWIIMQGIRAGGWGTPGSGKFSTIALSAVLLGSRLAPLYRHCGLSEDFPTS